jgi:hypothetical protein
MLAIHNAFRHYILQIDESVFKIARSGGDLATVLDRFHIIIKEILDYHATNSLIGGVEDLLAWIIL